MPVSSSRAPSAPSSAPVGSAANPVNLVDALPDDVAAVSPMPVSSSHAPSALSSAPVGSAANPVNLVDASPNDLVELTGEVSGNENTGGAASITWDSEPRVARKPASAVIRGG